MDGIHERRIRIPVLGLLLQHQPQPDPVGDISCRLLLRGRHGHDPGQAGQQVAEQRMGIGLTLQQTPPRHDGIGIILAAIAMVYRILQQTEHIGIERALHLALSPETHAPGLRQSDAVRSGDQVLQGPQPARLRQDGPVQATLLLGYQVLGDIFLELLHPLVEHGHIARRFDFEGHPGIEGTDV